MSVASRNPFALLEGMYLGISQSPTSIAFRFYNHPRLNLPVILTVFNLTLNIFSPPIQTTSHLVRPALLPLLQRPQPRLPLSPEPTKGPVVPPPEAEGTTQEVESPPHLTMEKAM